METRLRSWTKSASWRITGVVILGGISYVMTRDWEQTTIITTVFHTVRFLLYYAHERWWARIRWGRVHHPLAHLPIRGDLTPDDLEAIRKLLEERECLLGDYQI